MERRRLVVETLYRGEEYTTGRLHFLENNTPLSGGMGLVVELNDLWDEFILILALGARRAGIPYEHKETKTSVGSSFSGQTSI